MTKITLSLPAKPGEDYPNGGGEWFWMDKIADRLTQLLEETGAELTRVFSEQSKRTVFRPGSDLYLALCSQSAPADAAGQRKGLDVCYEEHCAASKQAAEVFAARLKEVYPQPELAGTRPVPETEIASVNNVPVLTVKLAYHDNPQDEAWLVNSTEEIAEKLAEATQEILRSLGVLRSPEGLEIPEIPGFHEAGLLEAPLHKEKDA